MPKRLSYAQDYWGYYNGASNTNLLYLSVPAYNDPSLNFQGDAIRNPDPNFASKGLLSKIIYPTKGYDSISYEGNTYSGPQEIKTNIQNLTTDANALGNSMATPLIAQQTFIPNQNQDVILSAYTNFIGNSNHPCRTMLPL